MLLWILLLAISYIIKAVDENAIEEATAELVDTTNTSETEGPTKELIRKIARRMELVNARSERRRRIRIGSKPFDEKSFRAAVGPRNPKHIRGPEAERSLRAVAFEGDMILNPEQIDELLEEDSDTDESGAESESEPESQNFTARRKRQAITNTNKMWNPDKAIPYHIENSLASYQSVIKQAISFWATHSCLKFKAAIPSSAGMLMHAALKQIFFNQLLFGISPYPKIADVSATEKNRLRFYRGDGCWSYVGNQGWTKQAISIGDGCQYFGLIAHEIAHALGAWHTQSRYDRDSYVTVNYANVDNSERYNFDKQSSRASQHFGLPYDYGSVMHYDPYDFAIDYNIPTITSKDVNYHNIMGQRESPSFYDVRQMNRLYKCASKCKNKPSCQNGGIVNPKKCSYCLCPQGFSGATCTSLQQGSGSACNGRTLEATSTPSSFTATVGNGNDDQWREDPYTCYWLIRAPAGQRIKFRLQSMDTYCMEFCDEAGFEVNTGNFGRSGMLFCCSSISSTWFNSNANLVLIRGTSRYNNANLVISYSLL